MFSIENNKKLRNVLKNLLLDVQSRQVTELQNMRKESVSPDMIKGFLSSSNETIEKLTNFLCEVETAILQREGC